MSLLVLKDGASVFSLSPKGTALDVSFLSGFASSVTTFARYVAGLPAPESRRPSETSTVVIDRHTFVLMTAGEAYTLVMHSSSPQAQSALQLQLLEVRQLLEFFFGAPHAWQHHFDVASVSDVLRGALARYETDLATLSPGLRVMPVSPVISAELDKELGALQQHSQIYSAALLLGSAVLHSRLPPEATRCIQTLLEVRPQGLLKLRAIPVFVGDWRQTVCIASGPYTVVLLCSLQLACADLLTGALETFEESFLEAQLSLPVEAPVLQIHQIAPPGVAAFVFHHSGSGVTVAPAPAAELTSGGAPGAQAVFGALFEVASKAMSSPAVETVQLTQDRFKFIASMHTDYQLFTLLHDDVDAGDVEEVVQALAAAALQYVRGG